MGLIFDIKAMQDTLLELEIDVNKMPLGKLSKRNIQQGVRSPFAVPPNTQAIPIC